MQGGAFAITESDRRCPKHLASFRPSNVPTLVAPARATALMVPVGSCAASYALSTRSCRFLRRFRLLPVRRHAGPPHASSAIDYGARPTPLRELARVFHARSAPVLQSREPRLIALAPAAAYCPSTAVTYGSPWLWLYRAGRAFRMSGGGRVGGPQHVSAALDGVRALIMFGRDVLRTCAWRNCIGPRAPALERAEASPESDS